MKVNGRDLTLDDITELEDSFFKQAELRDGETLIRAEHSERHKHNNADDIKDGGPSRT